MTDPNIDPTVPPKDAPPRGGTAKRVPPLAWIILMLLLLMVAVGVSQYGGAHITPGGGQTPTKDPAASEAVMPAPAN
jgi:hypothetical protein